MSIVNAPFTQKNRKKLPRGKNHNNYIDLGLKRY